MAKNQNEITIGRRTAGYALTMFRNNVSESELNGYLMNTKKDVDTEMVLCLYLWLKKICKTLPEKTLNAWGGQGCPRKPFFNWFFGDLKRMNEFRTFAFNWLQEQEKEAAALSAASEYGQDVDISGYPDLAEFNVQEERNRWESMLLSGAAVDPGDISRGAGLSPDAPAPGVYNFDAPF